MEQQTTLRVGVIGCGRIAQERHLPEYAANPRCRIAALYDPNAERMEALCRQYGCKGYTSAEELIADPDVDAVSVCTPNATHARYSVLALKAGKHVLCEKPCALSLAEARAMTDAAASSGKVLMIGHNQRLLPTHQRARALILQGAIGEVLLTQATFTHAGPESWSVDKGAGTWFFDRNKAKFGVLGDLGAHKLDLIRYLTGSEILSVNADLFTADKRDSEGRLIDMEDNAIVSMRMAGGSRALLQVGWTNYGQENNSTIAYGTAGVLKLFADPEFDLVLEKRDGSVLRERVGAIQTNDCQSSSGVIDEFVAAIAENRAPAVTGMDGYRTVAALLAIEASGRGGTWTEVEY